MSDKRLTPLFGERFWAERVSEREWHDCKYCYREVPTFILFEGQMGDQEPLSKMRCCWECGAGLEMMTHEQTVKMRADEVDA